MSFYSTSCNNVTKSALVRRAFTANIPGRRNEIRDRQRSLEQLIIFFGTISVSRKRSSRCRLVRWISDPEAGLVRNARGAEIRDDARAPERINEARLTRGRRTVLDESVISQANRRAREGSMSSVRNRRKTRRGLLK